MSANADMNGNALPTLGACLDDLLASRFHSNRSVDRIRSCGALPRRLERCAKALRPDTEWRAYRDGTRVHCAIARTHTRAAPPSQPREQGFAIDVYFLSEDGAVFSAGVWEHDQQHGWWLDAVLDASYDCDTGWWFDALVNPEPCTPRMRA